MENYNSKEELEAIMDAKNFVGRAPEQTEEFIVNVVLPIIEANKDLLDEEGGSVRV